TAIPDYKERIIARVLSVKDSVLKALDLGFEGANLICARGPFTEEFNHALLEQTGASIMITKDTGSEGGFEEKLRAAERAGVKTVVVRRPDDDGISLKDAISELGERLGIECVVDDKPETCIAIIGIGMGGGTLTVDATRRIASSDLLIGAERMLSSVNSAGKDVLKEYRANAILEYLGNHPEYRCPAVLVSGDVGFYSAAKKLLESVDREKYSVEVYCGISSLVYLSSRVGIPWQDIRLLSAHGKEANIISSVRSERSVFTLLTGSDGARRLCEDLIRFGMDGVHVIVGQDLGSDRERIMSGRPSELKNRGFSELCAAIIINDTPDRSIPIGLDAEVLIRGPAPMTKSEVSSLSVV
ncbi:MAG: precorrin-6y C5,15-methyltransferase (decarboxylating) subunit CbiE, partial [Candidatus Methanomethylophilaceae archaeon]|nr:precorrin-6y C5,15-methyltransferase (decarboxylating) subunit CbiE [Candidatus Methanomethylophilaceae archaeon]